MPLSATAYIDFGYPWWLSYGHLPILALAAPMLLLGYARKWSKWPMLFLSSRSDFANPELAVILSPSARSADRMFLRRILNVTTDVKCGRSGTGNHLRRIIPGTFRFKS